MRDELLNTSTLVGNSSVFLGLWFQLYELFVSNHTILREFPNYRATMLILGFHLSTTQPVVIDGSRDSEATELKKLTTVLLTISLVLNQSMALTCVYMLLKKS